MTPTPGETEILLQAFTSFAEVSDSLEKTFAGLRDQVQRLSRELEEKNHYLGSLLQNLPCGVMVVDSGGQVTTLSERCRQLLSLPPVDLPCSVNGLSKLSNLSGALDEFWEGEPEPREMSFEDGDGSVRVLSRSWSFMKNDSRVVILQDVTRVRALERKMQEAERLAAMGELAFEVAHEIRNPLGGLELFASLLRDETLQEEERERYLDHMQIGIRSLNNILSNMLSFSRQPEPDKGPVVLPEVLDEIASFMEPLLKQREISVTRQYQDCRPVSVDRGMIQQMFTNLVLNALEALPQGGQVRLSTRRRKRDAVVSIHDNGVGIPPELREAIFKPRFTTNRKGNGLGLAIVKRFMELHGGTIRLRSKRGWGTEFTLIFPLGEVRDERATGGRR